MVAQRFSLGTAKKAASRKAAPKKAAAAKPAAKRADRPSQFRIADEMLSRIERRNDALLAHADRLLKLVS